MLRMPPYLQVYHCLKYWLFFRKSSFLGYFIVKNAFFVNFDANPAQIKNAVPSVPTVPSVPAQYAVKFKICFALF
jgi:hypothetical protein